MNLVCPHCNGQITAPAPAAQPGKPAAKLGMSAVSTSHAEGPKPAPFTPPTKPATTKKNTKWVTPVVAGLAVCGASAFLFVHPEYIKWAGTKVGLVKSEPIPETNTAPAVVEVATNAEPVVTNSPPAFWNLALASTSFPNYHAKGSIMGSEFTVDTARIDGTVLSLIQGTGPVPDREFIIYLHLLPGDTLDSQKFVVGPEDKTGVPQLLKRWRPDPAHGLLSKSFPNGYAMKLEFGNIQTGKLPGKIYLSAPDDEHSFVAGTFEAVIKQPGTQTAMAPQVPTNQPSSRQRNSRYNPNGPAGPNGQRLPRPTTGGGNMVPVPPLSPF